MRTLALLVAKDLKRKARAPLGFLVVLSFPVVFSLLIALSFGSKGDRVPRIHLLVESHDDGFAARVLLSGLTSRQAAEHMDVEVVGSEGAARLEAGEATALLRIPKSFTDDILAGRPVSLGLVRNPAQGILPEITEQLARVMVDALDAGAHVLREPLDQLRPYLQSDGRRMTDPQLASVSLDIRRTVEGAATLLSPPVISVDSDALTPRPSTTKKDSGPSASLIFLAILPGVSVYALFLVGDQGMRDLITEATTATLRRQLAGPIGTGTIVLGKALYSAVLSLVAFVVLTVVGGVVLRKAVDPAGFVLLSLAIILAVTGTAATIYGLTLDERRGATISSIVYLVLAFAGGSFVNLEGLPPAVRRIAPASLFYWGTTGFRKLIESAATLSDVLPNVAVLAGLGTALLALGAFLLDRAVRRGRLA